MKSCDCKGKRSCLLCENLLDKKPINLYQEFQSLNSFVFCVFCQKIYRGWDAFTSCSEHEPEGIEFPGVFILLDFLIDDGATKKLVDEVDNTLGWDASQSGRRKKNYGPKVNFKKKKLSVGSFKGFPAITNYVRNRLKDVPVLQEPTFEVVEECFLEYDVARGSHIEPHIDDCWIWGERVVTVNCVGDSVLTLRKHVPVYPQQYNIDFMQEYEGQLIEPLQEDIDPNSIIRVPMPARSLIVLYGPPRFQYEHSVLREDIVSRRVAIAYREFTIPYQKSNDKYNEAEEIYKLSGLSFL